MIKHLKNLKMAKRKSTIRRNPPAPNLIIPRTEAEIKIYDRVTLGNALLGLSIHDENVLEAAKTQRKKWNDYNEELLRRLFDSEVVLEDYNRSSLYDTPIKKSSWGQKISSFYEGISNKIEALESITKRLEFIPEKVIISETQERYKPGISNTVVAVHGHDDEVNDSITEKLESIPEKVIISETQEKYEPEISDTVVVVHGEEDEAKISVATFIEKLGLKAVILHEQPNAGQTIIEKFEHNAAISGYAVVILTSNNAGASKEDTDDAKLRARQNVMLELGYFCGALGRKRVSVLEKEGVDIPSDFLGISCTLFDPGGDWQLSLARDMKSAGLSFDANRIF
jgi:predicted nucleotide-binding protein